MFMVMRWRLRLKTTIKEEGASKKGSFREMV
jgi:hypothetical protein